MSIKYRPRFLPNLTSTYYYSPGSSPTNHRAPINQSINYKATSAARAQNRSRPSCTGRCGRAACQLPVLRKDFTLDPYQIWEARALGADAILLIVACLELPHLKDLHDCACDAGLDVLVEVHDEAELDEALTLGGDLIGINNRDLHTFKTSLDTTYGLLEHIPAGVQVVTESGFSSAAQVSEMRGRGVHTFLIGETFMRAEDPGAALATMFPGD